MVSAGRFDRERIPTSGTPPATHAARTSVMWAPASPRPVFVDDSGRRHRRLRTVLYVLACLIVAAAITVWLSVSASPVHPAPLPTCTSGQSAHSSGCRR